MIQSEQFYRKIKPNMNREDLIKYTNKIISLDDERSALMIVYLVINHLWPSTITQAALYILRSKYRSWAITVAKMDGWWPYSDQDTSRQIISSFDDNQQAIRWASADGWFQIQDIEFTIE